MKTTRKSGHCPSCNTETNVVRRHMWTDHADMTHRAFRCIHCRIEWTETETGRPSTGSMEVEGARMPSHSKSLGDRLQIAVYIDRDLKARLEALATADERSLNTYIVRLIREHVEKESRDKAASNE